jgi:hypothetical protein
VTDELEKRALAAQGRRVLLESLGWALGLTALVTALPF